MTYEVQVVQIAMLLRISVSVIACKDNVRGGAVSKTSGQSRVFGHIERTRSRCLRSRYRSSRCWCCKKVSIIIRRAMRITDEEEAEL